MKISFISIFFFKKYVIFIILMIVQTLEKSNETIWRLLSSEIRRKVAFFFN